MLVRMRLLEKTTEPLAERSGIGKLIVFAAPEAGVGRSVCAANVAAILAQRSHCLAADLDARSQNFQTHLGMVPVVRGIAEFLNDSSVALDSIESSTRVTNLRCTGWSAGGARPLAFGLPKIDILVKSLQ